MGRCCGTGSWADELPEIVHHVKIWAAIVVVIEEAGGQPGTVDGGLAKQVRNVAEGPIAIIVEQTMVSC